MPQSPPQVSDRDDLAYLLSYARGLRERWHLVIAGIVCGAVAAALYSWASPALYRTTLKLLVVPTRLQETVAPGLNEQTLAARYLPYVRNADVLRKAIETAGMAGAEHAHKFARFDRKFSATTMREAPVIELTLDFADGDEGVRLVRAIASQAIELNKQLLTQSDADSRQFLGQQVESTRKRLRELEQQHQDAARAARLEERRGELEALAVQIAEAGTLILEKSTDAAELTSSTDAMEKALSGEQKLIPLRRTLIDDPAAFAMNSGAAPSRPIVTETINPLYEQIEPKLAEERSRLAGVLAGRDHLRADLPRLRARAHALSDRLHQDQLAIEQITIDLELARAHYRSVSEHYDRAGVAVMAQSADLRVFEEPRPGTVPVSPRIVPNLIFGSVLGLLIGALVAIIAAIVVPRRQRAGDIPAAHHAAV
jgi:uncharacterized protein involved in exopolysaccharide biosynthesis